MQKTNYLQGRMILYLCMQALTSLNKGCVWEKDKALPLQIHRAVTENAEPCWFASILPTA